MVSTRDVRLVSLGMFCRDVRLVLFSDDRDVPAWPVGALDGTGGYHRLLESETADSPDEGSRTRNGRRREETCADDIRPAHTSTLARTAMARSCRLASACPDHLDRQHRARVRCSRAQRRSGPDLVA